MKTQDILARIGMFLGREPRDELDAFLVGDGRLIVVMPEERAMTWNNIHRHVRGDRVVQMHKLGAAYEQRWPS